MTETPAASADADLDGSTALDRRRGTMQATKSAAEVAVAALDSLDQQLKANAELRSGHEADLQAALDRVATLKKTIKASVKDRDRLLTDRKTARRVAASARQRATVAETKYDKAVLADMLRREKEHDLSAHSDTAHSDTTDSSNTADSSDKAATSPAGTSRARTPAARAPRARATSTRTAAARTAGARQSSTTTRPRTEPADGAGDSATSPSEGPDHAG